MNARPFSILLVVCALSILSGWGGKLTDRQAMWKQVESWNDANTDFGPISHDIEIADSVTLYEGLPHQAEEKNLLERELATKKTILIASYPFYERLLHLADDEVEPLRRLSSDRNNYVRPAIVACGGFHPDDCLAWKAGETKRYLLICFGCGKIFFHNAKGGLMADMTETAEAQFKEILNSHRDQRPDTDG